MRQLLWLSVFPALLAGCAPLSVHPLSDDANSQIEDRLMELNRDLGIPPVIELACLVIDDGFFEDRLIGVWRQKTALGDRSKYAQFTIGIAEGKERTHEAVAVSLDDDRTVKVERITFWATKINGRTYLTVLLPDESMPARYANVICDFPADGQLQIALLNE